MKLLIIGARYNGTTSLEKYLKDQNFEVKRHESLFDNPKGPNEWYFNYCEYTPVIILSEKKKHLFDFEELIKKWAFTHPIIYRLEHMQKDPNFPKLNIGSTLKGTFKTKHEEYLNEM